MLDDILTVVNETVVNETVLTISESLTNTLSSTLSTVGISLREQYCSNHCTKALHKDLQRVKQAKCAVSIKPGIHIKIVQLGGGGG